VTNGVRKTLEEATYTDLDEMMAAYAAAAVTVAQENYRQLLDYNSGSLVAFEAVLSELAEKSDLDYDYEVKLWGGLPGRGATAALYGELGDDAVSGWRSGGASDRGARVAAFSADEGVPAADDGRLGEHCRVF